MMKVGITGGIGSGKSTVCRLFEAKGVAVYDSDASAKRLMASELKEAVVARFGAAAYPGGELDRGYLADVVFNDPQALSDLNAIVHPAVMRDFEAWCERQQGDYVILECAILFDAGFDRCVDQTVAVLAPESLRVERASQRDHTDAESVRRRMAAQLDDDALSARANYTLVNIFEEDLEPGVVKLDRIFRHEAQKP